MSFQAGDPLEDVHRHLSAAMLSLADFIGVSDPLGRPELLDAARLLTEAQRRITVVTRDLRQVPAAVGKFGAMG